MEKLKSGFLLLLKPVLVLGLVYGGEYALTSYYSQKYPDKLSQLLIPFHDNYFSFSPYYLTFHTSGFTFGPGTSPTLKFFILSAFGTVIFAILTLLANQIKAYRNLSPKIKTLIFYSTFLIYFVEVFFIPQRKTVVDPENKELILTRFQYGLIPETNHIPFSQINSIHYQATLPERNSRTKGYNYSVKFYAITQNDSFLIEKWHHSLSTRCRNCEDKNWKLPTNISSTCDEVVGELYRVMHLK